MKVLVLWLSENPRSFSILNKSQTKTLKDGVKAKAEGKWYPVKVIAEHGK